MFEHDELLRQRSISRNLIVQTPYQVAGQDTSMLFKAYRNVANAHIGKSVDARCKSLTPSTHRKQVQNLLSIVPASQYLASKVKHSKCTNSDPPSIPSNYNLPLGLPHLEYPPLASTPFALPFVSQFSSSSSSSSSSPSLLPIIS